MEDLDILRKAGLNEAQAEIYDCLLRNGIMSPIELANETGQSRENCYMITKRLAELGLLEQIDGRRIKYQVLNPSALESLIEKRHQSMIEDERYVKDNLPLLLDVFYANSEMPGARVLKGIDGVKEIYEDILRTKKDVYLLGTGLNHVLSKHKKDKAFLDKYRDRASSLEINTFALTPITRETMGDAKAKKDETVLLHRTWMPEDDFDSPLTIQIYGDKTALITFGETIMITVVTSPIIAEAMRQVLTVMMRYYQIDFEQDY